MRVWAVANQKGGVGKTTTSVSLAGLLAASGKRTLLLDLDPHGSLTSYFGLNPDALAKSAYWLFQTRTPDPSGLLVDTGVPQLTLLPASSALATLDRQLGAEEGKGLMLLNALERVAHRFEYVLVDCPPVLGVLMVNALAACERLVIPVQTEFLALKGLERILNTIGMVRHALRRTVPYTIVPTMYDRRTRAALETLKTLYERYPEQMWDGVIPIDTQFREASQRRLPLPVMNPKARGTLAYSTLLHSLMSAPIHDDVEAVL